MSLESYAKSLGTRSKQGLSDKDIVCSISELINSSLRSTTDTTKEEKASSPSNYACVLDRSILATLLTYNHLPEAAIKLIHSHFPESLEGLYDSSTPLQILSKQYVKTVLYLETLRERYHKPDISSSNRDAIKSSFKLQKQKADLLYQNIKLLLSLGANPSPAVETTTRLSEIPFNPIHCAARINDDALMSLLLKTKKLRLSQRTGSRLQGDKKFFIASFLFICIPINACDVIAIAARYIKFSVGLLSIRDSRGRTAAHQAALHLVNNNSPRLTNYEDNQPIIALSQIHTAQHTLLEIIKIDLSIVFAIAHDGTSTLDILLNKIKTRDTDDLLKLTQIKFVLVFILVQLPHPKLTSFLKRLVNDIKTSTNETEKENLYQFYQLLWCSLDNKFCAKNISLHPDIFVDAPGTEIAGLHIHGYLPTINERKKTDSEDTDSDKDDASSDPDDNIWANKPTVSP